MMKECKAEIIEKFISKLEKSRTVKIFKNTLIVGSILVAILGTVSAIVLYRTDFIKKSGERAGENDGRGNCKK